jgi:hypothetical protein
MLIIEAEMALESIGRGQEDTECRQVKVAGNDSDEGVRNSTQITP